jgi:hypothetical protein
VARKRDPSRPQKAGRRSHAPVVRPEKWFWIIVTFFGIVIGAFFLLGLLRSAL